MKALRSSSWGGSTFVVSSVALRRKRDARAGGRLRDRDTFATERDLGVLPRSETADEVSSVLTGPAPFRETLEPAAGVFERDPAWALAMRDAARTSRARRAPPPPQARPAHH